MKENSLYTNGHLFVAAVRILNHLNNAPPRLEEVADLLKCSPELGNLILRRLVREDIIEPGEGPYGQRLFIRDHRNLENLMEAAQKSGFDEALEKFKSRHKNMDREISVFQEKQSEKKKNLFAELEKQMKKKMDSDG